MQQLAAAVMKETKRSRSATAQSLTAPLRGVRVLIVEDDFIILHDLETLLAEAGAEVIGPCQTVAGALAAADGSVSAAILDVSLRSETVEPVAVRLSEFGVPFLFYTGQLGTDELLAKWPGKTVVQKPADGKILVAAVAGLLARIQDRDTS